jgi:modulator of FtsH protease
MAAMMVPADWHDFATMIGGATGALTGLLFVALSLNASRIAGHTGLRASAAQTLVLFITPLLIAAVLLTPRQPDWVLGVELIAIGSFASFILRRAERLVLPAAAAARPGIPATRHRAPPRRRAATLRTWLGFSKLQHWRSPG